MKVKSYLTPILSILILLFGAVFFLGSQSNLDVINIYAADNNCCSGTDCASHGGDWVAGYNDCLAGKCSKCAGGSSGGCDGDGKCEAGENEGNCRSDCAEGGESQNDRSRDGRSSKIRQRPTTSTSSGTKCSGALSASACKNKNPGDPVPGTCTCQQTDASKNYCACVGGRNFPDGQKCDGSSECVSGWCRDVGDGRGRICVSKDVGKAIDSESSNPSNDRLSDEEISKMHIDSLGGGGTNENSKNNARCVSGSIQISNTSKCKCRDGSVVDMGKSCTGPATVTNPTRTCPKGAVPIGDSDLCECRDSDGSRYAVDKNGTCSGGGIDIETVLGLKNCPANSRRRADWEDYPNRECKCDFTYGDGSIVYTSFGGSCKAVTIEAQVIAKTPVPSAARENTCVGLFSDLLPNCWGQRANEIAKEVKGSAEGAYAKQSIRDQVISLISERGSNPECKPFDVKCDGSVDAYDLVVLGAHVGEILIDTTLTNLFGKTPGDTIKAPDISTALGLTDPNNEDFFDVPIDSPATNEPTSDTTPRGQCHSSDVAVCVTGTPGVTACTALNGQEGTCVVTSGTDHCRCRVVESAQEALKTICEALTDESNCSKVGDTCSVREDGVSYVGICTKNASDECTCSNRTIVDNDNGDQGVNPQSCEALTDESNCSKVGDTCSVREDGINYVGTCTKNASDECTCSNRTIIDEDDQQNASGLPCEAASESCADKRVDDSCSELTSGGKVGTGKCTAISSTATSASCKCTYSTLTNMTCNNSSVEDCRGQKANETICTVLGSVDGSIPDRKGVCKSQSGTEVCSCVVN